MRLVHLYANWKWTGPADPAVSLAAALAERGHKVTFIPGRQVADLENRIVTEAKARGLTARRC